MAKRQQAEGEGDMDSRGDAAGGIDGKTSMHGGLGSGGIGSIAVQQQCQQDKATRKAEKMRRKDDKRCRRQERAATGSASAPSIAQRNTASDIDVQASADVAHAMAEITPSSLEYQVGHLIVFTSGASNSTEVGGNAEMYSAQGGSSTDVGRNGGSDGMQAGQVFGATLAVQPGQRDMLARKADRTLRKEAKRRKRQVHAGSSCATATWTPPADHPSIVEVITCPSEDDSSVDFGEGDIWPAQASCVGPPKERQGARLRDVSAPGGADDGGGGRALGGGAARRLLSPPRLIGPAPKRRRHEPAL